MIMKKITKLRLLLIVTAFLMTSIYGNAVSLWVGQTYTWDFSSAVMGSTYNMSVSVSGGYLSITGSGFYRNIKPTQYFGGTATVTAEWDYTLYYGDTKRHQKVTLTISCYENPVSIYPQSVTLYPGETYQLGYKHSYDNQYVGAANVYFSGGNSSFSVSSSGLITAKSPGTGYATVYSKVSNASNAPSCYVTVKEVEPTGVSISNIWLLADESKALSATVSPSNASVKTKTWYIKSGNDVVSISGQNITGLKPGKATIYCMVNGSVRSNDATVTVSEPKLTQSSSFPANDATGISVFVNPSLTYSHTLSKGDGFDAISLTGNGVKVNGVAEISDKTIRFLPSKPLDAQTNYQLYVPSNAVKNKWGSPAQSNVTLSFKTGDLEKATVTMTPASGNYLTKNDAVTISAYPSDAEIHYTIDGSTPNASSAIYTGPIKCENDFVLKAFAIREGYENSDVVTAEYFKSQSEILSFYPSDANPLFNYALVTPYLKLSGEVEKSNNFRRISMKDESGNEVSGKSYITQYLVVFVPDEPLKNSTKYTIDIPYDALKTVNGEVFKGFTWSFTTPTMPSKIAMQGDESVFILNEDGALKTRGMEYLTTNVGNGSFTFKDYESLSNLLTGIDDISGGYSHKMVQDSKSAIGSGLAFCGETGTSSSISSIGTIKSVKAGFQTSAIIGDDNSLWMCGRNDFYQLGDGSGTTSKSFIKVAENVIDVALGNGFTLYVDTDNVLWGVGRNHRGQLGNGTTENCKNPLKIMEGVSKVYASSSGFFSACITTGGSLMTWGDNSIGQLGRESNDYSAIPTAVLDNVVSASLGESHALALTEDYKLYSWGSNEYGQIAVSGTSVKIPTLMADNIVMAYAGPKTSLLLYRSGKVTGWGRKAHNNFGSGSGNTTDYLVSAGVPYSALQGVVVEPSRFEVKPGSEFALVSMPKPYEADYETIEWISSHPEVASVDMNGVIKTDALGEAEIIVKYTNRFGVSKTANSIVICTETPDNSGVSDIRANNWFAYSKGHSIVVDNSLIGETYFIFNTQGMVLGEKVSDNQRFTFDVNRAGVYIIRSGSKSVKVICK